MQHVRQPNPWQHVEALDDATILAHLQDHKERVMPEAGRRLREAGKDYRRASQMKSRLEGIARDRGLIE